MFVGVYRGNRIIPGFRFTVRCMDFETIHSIGADPQILSASLYLVVWVCGLEVWGWFPFSLYSLPEFMNFKTFWEAILVVDIKFDFFS